MACLNLFEGCFCLEIAGPVSVLLHQKAIYAIILPVQKTMYDIRQVTGVCSVLHETNQETKMKLLKLTLVMILSLAMLTGCGGGGGSSNPAAPAYDQLLQNDYPAVYNSYVEMQSALENNTTDITTRMASFSSYIATPFYDLKGDSNRTSLLDTTKSRLERYEVKAWTLVPFNHVKVDDNTVKVHTRMVISVELKPGETSGNPGTYYFGDTSKNEPAIVFTWVKENDNKWRIQSGLPY